MALGPRTTFDVRSGGSSLNGGGINPGNVNVGPDTTQQNAAATVRTDLVIGAGNSLTSAAVPFDSTTEQGLLIHITAGTNFTPGFYEITSIAGAVATLDRSPGTLAASGGTGRVGGALSSLADIPQATLVGGNTIYFQVSGGYTTSGGYVLTASGSDAAPISYIGYGTVRTDQQRPVFTASGNNAVVALSGSQVIMKNFEVDGANIADRGIEVTAGAYLENWKVSRCNFSGLRALGAGIQLSRGRATLNGSGAGADGVGINLGTGSEAQDCEADHNTNGLGVANTTASFLRCLSHHNTLAGAYSFGVGGIRMRNCILDANTGDGLRYTQTHAMDSTLVRGCVFSNNGGWGMNSVTVDYSTLAAAPLAAMFQKNAFYNNTSGLRRQVPTGAAEITLTADPYTSQATGDYSLNGNTGGGAALQGTGLPGAFGLIGTGTSLSVGHLDVGAVQGLAQAPATTATALMRSLWRELANEPFTPGDATSAVPDSRVDVYLDFGLQDVNREAHYHWSDALIALVAGQQEYSLPVDFVLAQFLQYAGFRRLDRGSVDRWMSDNEDWRNEVGQPRFWAIYSNKLIVRPTPTSQAVADAPNLTLRYCSTPPSITTNGPEQLGSQEYRLAVQRGVQHYSIMYPESLLAQQRIAEIQKLWEASMPKVVQEYGQRNIGN